MLANKPLACLFVTISFLSCLSALPAPAAPAPDAIPVDSAKQTATSSNHRPSTSTAILKQAQFHTTRREFKQALELWTKLAQTKPDALAEANIGWSYLQLGDKEKALAHINRSIKIKPRTIEGWRYLGYYLMGEGKVPDAVKAFRTSMGYDPHHKCNCGVLEKLILSKSKARKP